MLAETGTGLNAPRSVCNAGVPPVLPAWGQMGGRRPWGTEGAGVRGAIPIPWAVTVPALSAWEEGMR